jgi:N-acetylglucosamine kinase-like BadF-type ATPase
MSDGARELLLGVDGGNSKTDLVIATSDGDVLAEVRGGGTHSHRVGVPAMIAGLAELVGEARQKAGLGEDEPIAVGTFFIANLDVPDAEAEALRELARWGLCRRTEVRNDTLAPLRAGAPEAWGISLVSGAGINAVGMHPDGREERFLALGDVTGDWGGGHAVGLAGLGAAVRAGDGRGPATALRELIAAYFGYDSPEQVALALADDQLTTEALHELSPVVFAAAERGDPVAVGIAMRLADEVVTLVTALIRRLGLESEPTPVVLAGGTLQFGPDLLIDAIRERLARVFPLAQPRVLDVRPVAGAVLAALDLVGHTPDGEARIRATLGAREAVDS